MLPSAVDTLLKSNGVIVLKYDVSLQGSGGENTVTLPFTNVVPNISLLAYFSDYLYLQSASHQRI